MRKIIVGFITQLSAPVLKNNFVYFKKIFGWRQGDIVAVLIKKDQVKRLGLFRWKG